MFTLVGAYREWILDIIGGFQLEFVSISRVINHMTCYNSSALIAMHWWKIYFFLKNPLQDLLPSLNPVILTNKSNCIHNNSCDL